MQTGMRTKEITAIESVGNCAIRPVFSDGQDSGIYSWDFLHSLCCEHEHLWQTYLQRLEAAGFTHDAGRDTPMIKQGVGCPSHQDTTSLGRYRLAIDLARQVFRSGN